MPKYWVPTLYIMEGIPFSLVAGLSIILYKNLDITNTKIAFITSLFTIPFFLKPFLAPLFENLASKRTLILLMSYCIFVFCLLLAASLSSANFFYASVLIFFLVAFASTILDMNADGLYIICLDNKTQAFYIGIRTISYQIGRLICEGALVIFASLFFSTLGIQLSWQITFVLLSAYILLTTLYHTWVLPKDVKVVKDFNIKKNIRELYHEFFKLPNLRYALIFIFLYQSTVYQLNKIVPLFLLDVHGMGLSTSQVGIVYGVIGTIAMLIGILLSGILLANISLRQLLVPVTAFTALTNIGYFALFITHSLQAIGFFIAVAQLGNGLTNGVYMMYLLLSFGTGKYPMSLYAMGTALMGLSMTFAGGASGYLQSLLGFYGFFIWILVLSVIIILFSMYLLKKDVVIAKTNLG